MASDKTQFLPLSHRAGDQSERKGSTMTKNGAYAAIAYMASAVLLLMFNKAALSSYNFPCANVITLFQILCSSVILYALRRRRIISFEVGEPQRIDPSPAILVPTKTLVQTFPLAFSYLLYMLLSMESVRGINVPMYTTLRRTTVAFTMIVEYFLTRQKYTSSIVGRYHIFLEKFSWQSREEIGRSANLLNLIVCFVFNCWNLLHPVESRLNSVALQSLANNSDCLHRRNGPSLTGMEALMFKMMDLISVGIMILGAIVAGARDLTFDAYAYTVVFLTNICTAIYLASIVRIGKSSGLNTFGLMWCNGIVSGPILLLWTSIRGDLQMMMNFPHLFSPGFQAVMILSCILAFLINYCVFLNTTMNSALTQSVCGNLKDLFTISVGWFIFGGLPYDLLNVVGQTLGFLGSCLYAFCKLRGK